MNLRTAFLLFTLALLSATRALHAADEPAPPPADFAKGTWTLSLYTGYDRECAGDPQLAYGAVGASYYVADDLSLSAEARTYFVRQKDAGSDAAMFELDLMVRHHVLKGENWSLFIEAGAGLTQSTRAVPAGGTHFNFMEEAGVGGTYRLADGVHLIGGVRYWHVSNAQIEGKDKNPALNGYGGYVGVMFRL